MNQTLECSALRVDRGGRRILHDINFRMALDECVSLVGPNGSGKTTLIRALLGLLVPAAGRVRWGGVDVRRIAPRQRARWAAYVPQRLDASPALTVTDVVATGRFAHSSGLRPLSPADQAAVAAAMGACGVSPLAEQSFDTLSGGERQKIGRAHV